MRSMPFAPPWGRHRTCNDLRGIMKEAWDFVEEVGTTKEHCQAVIEAHGGHKKY